MSYQPILCVIARAHWPIPGYTGHAQPAIGDAYVCAQFLANAREDAALRGLCEAVFPSTSDGRKGVERRYPGIPLNDLGYFLWFEIESEVDA